MSSDEARAEAERRYVMEHGAWYSFPRGAVEMMLRGAFVAGAEWQAEQHKTGLDAVSELHRPARLVRGDSEFCHECTDPWPCRTARALEERTDT